LHAHRNMLSWSLERIVWLGTRRSPMSMLPRELVIKILSDAGPRENCECHKCKDGYLFAQLAGRWKPAQQDRSEWMKGLEIGADGTFHTKWDGRRHLVTDGRVHRSGEPHQRTVGTSGTINLRRTCAGANDHLFEIDSDFNRMQGRCPQSGCTYTLTRITETTEQAPGGVHARGSNGGGCSVQ